VYDKDTEFLKRSRIEEDVDPFPGREPSRIVDLFDPLLATAEQSGIAFLS